MAPESRRPRRITALTGIRDLAYASEYIVDAAIAIEIALGVDELRFGGAIGVETIALCAASVRRTSRIPVLRVIVPATVADQPLVAARAIDRFADVVIELGLPARDAASLMARNRILVAGARKVLGFTDGRTTGGTAWTIDHARNEGLIVGACAIGRAPHAGPTLMNEVSRILARHVTSADELTLIERLTLSTAYAEAWIDAWAAVTGSRRPESGSPIWKKLMIDAVPKNGEEYRSFGLEPPEDARRARAAKRPSVH